MIKIKHINKKIRKTTTKKIKSIFLYIPDGLLLVLFWIVIVVVVVVDLGGDKSIELANNEDLVARSKSKLKSSFFNRSEFSNSFAANISDGSNVKLDWSKAIVVLDEFLVDVDEDDDV